MVQPVTEATTVDGTPVSPAPEAPAYSDESFYADERYKAFQANSNKAADSLRNQVSALTRQVEDLTDTAEAVTESSSPDDPAAKASELRRVGAAKELRTKTRELEDKTRALDERLATMNRGVLDAAIERFSKEYGVPRHKLAELETVEAVELYALRNRTAAPTTDPANPSPRTPQPDRGGGGGAQSTGTPPGLHGLDRISDALKSGELK